MDLTAFIYALLSGILPALLWLWFWLREDSVHPEPRSLIIGTFVGGMIVVPLVVPFQHIALDYYGGNINEVVYFVWAALEEFFKFGVAYVIALRTRFMDEPIDALIYMITAALGFAAMENTFFLLKPLLEGDAMTSIVTGNLRFIGATLLHVVSSATIGLFIALPYYQDKIKKTFDLMLGLVFAAVLHAAFNLFIITSKGSDTFIVFGCVWLAVIVLILLFEKVKRIPYEKRKAVVTN